MDKALDMKRLNNFSDKVRNLSNGFRSSIAIFK